MFVKDHGRGPGIIALVTDFGLADPYVGQVKGVLAGIAPQALVVDISHHVQPFNVAQAGFFLAASAPHFPEETVFMAVVDPGVGAKRAIVAVKKAGQVFLAPDNGLLEYVLDPSGPQAPRAFDLTLAQSTPGAQAPRSVSATFHGRDRFAWLAARLALGEDPADMGPEVPLDRLAHLKWRRPKRFEPEPLGKEISAHVLHVDRFGNCVLNLLAGSPFFGRLLDGGPCFALRLLSPLSERLRLARTYADLGEGELGLLAGSQGFLELALNQAPAARRLGLSVGDNLSMALDMERE
ncbi:MAG: SAM-dependent chlorinase/fluorinase [Desulfovibrionaceae bacterium]|nr:SAM-dependent chlorinase/fluorinase [Desulfovibrionaceae bacterium]